MENYVPIQKFANDMQAQLAQATLAAANIESFISSDDVGGMLPSLDQASGIRLLVDKKDEEEARTVLNSTSEPAEE
jgi:hypothetical protein